MSALRPTAARLMPRMTSAQPFAQAPPAALASRQAERLELLVAHPHYKPRISDPPLPPRPYPSPLNAPLRPGRKAQRSAWLGPEDGEVAPPQAPTWVVNPLSTLAAEAAGREPDEWFVRRVEHSGFMPVYTDVSRGGDRVITIVRKVEGNATTLLHALLTHLSTLPPPSSRSASLSPPPADSSNSRRSAKPMGKGVIGRVNPTSKQLEIKGSWRDAVRKWLVEQGM